MKCVAPLLLSLLAPTIGLGGTPFKGLLTDSSGTPISGLGGFGQRFVNRGVSPWSAACALPRSLPPFHVHRVLCFVGHVRGSVFHRRDARIRVSRSPPLWFDPFFLRFRSIRARSSRVGVAMPLFFSADHDQPALPSPN